MVSSVSAISSSGMNAAMSRLGSSAHNIANLSTEGFRRQTTQSSEGPGGGVNVSLSRAAEPGAALETDMVEQLAGKHAFLANLAVFKTQNAMLGSMLDISA